jgi:hypothetical protein
VSTIGETVTRARPATGGYGGGGYGGGGGNETCRDFQNVRVPHSPMSVSLNIDGFPIVIFAPTCCGMAYRAAARVGTRAASTMAMVMVVRLLCLPREYWC